MIFQLNEAQTSQEELTKLRMEQKRLSQECAENQQMISVLEMQRDILAKSVSSSLCSTNASLLTALIYFQPSKSASGNTSSKVEVEKLVSELKLLRAKLVQTEAEKSDLERKLSVSAPQVKLSLPKIKFSLYSRFYA